MNPKIIISVIVTIFLLIAVGIGVYLSMNPQDFFPSAQQTDNTAGGSCPAPGTPGTVTLSYPYCDSVGGAAETCVFDKAGCVWESVSGATKYSIKVTEVETGATIATETVNAPATKTSFPVVQGRTYKCEVSAINSCGSTGGTNEDTLLCETDAFVSDPSPTPVAPPPPPPPATIAPPPPPPPASTPLPTPSPLACGFQGCSNTVPCQNGFVCIETSAGQNYCARSEYQSQCYRTPNEPSCCQAPPPKPTLPPAGALDTTLIIGGAGMGLVILGAAALLLL